MKIFQEGMKEEQKDRQTDRQIEREQEGKSRIKMEKKELKWTEREREGIVRKATDRIEIWADS